MYKGIEWLKEEIGELPCVDTVFNSGGSSYIDSAVPVMSVYDLIDQLDEPETLSEHWIEQKSVSFHVDTLSGELQVTFRMGDLQEALLPKQEGLEAKIQDLIETYKQEDGAYSNPENAWIGGFIEDLENLVEAEQKYYVLNTEGETMIRKSDSEVRTSSGFKIRNGFEGENYKFTEQEIKEYDDRFWPFAVKVEELE